ncbi:molybdenum cofactor guanylyltransferase [Flavobacterium sp.]|uniref:molybdenum cofactor guanylyltransferase n=1 Tax=Flavobacterium sp. TaxID=239 RepID=UPI00260EED70|nr:molybdenum cofactor guanylyltransferase [Flavobacterium sp.]
MITIKTYLLSGGKSSRMGEDKGLKFLSGKPMISYLVDTLRQLDIIPVIIAHHPGYKSFGLTVIPDKIKDKGPLGGIYTALSHARETVLIISADTPFVDSQAIEYLIRHHIADRINVLDYKGKIQPLCGLYPFQLLPKIESNLIANKLKMMDFVTENDANIVSIPFESNGFQNINTPEELSKAEYEISNNFKTV